MHLGTRGPPPLLRPSRMSYCGPDIAYRPTCAETSSETIPPVGGLIICTWRTFVFHGPVNDHAVSLAGTTRLSAGPFAFLDGAWGATKSGSASRSVRIRFSHSGNWSPHRTPAISLGRRHCHSAWWDVGPRAMVPRRSGGGTRRRALSNISTALAPWRGLPSMRCTGPDCGRPAARYRRFAHRSTRSGPRTAVSIPGALPPQNSGFRRERINWLPKCRRIAKVDFFYCTCPQRAWAAHVRQKFLSTWATQRVRPLLRWPGIA